MPSHARSRSNSEAQSDKEHTASDLAAQLAVTRAELAALQERYDALRADRDRLAQTLEEKMKIWKRFKQWIFISKSKVPSKAKRVGSSTPGSRQQSAVEMLEMLITPKKLRSTRETAQPSPTKSVSPRRSPLSPNKHILNTPRRARTFSEGSPSTRCLKRRRDENEDITVEEMSQTQEDSQALSFWRPSTPSQRERVRRLSLSSCPPTPQRIHGLHSPPSTKRPRRSVESVSGTVLVPVQTISRYRRGRNGGPTTLNAEFEIDPKANAGIPFAFDEVVRGQQHRHGLNAGECEECRGWYAAVGPLPPRLEAPQWGSPLRSTSPTLVASDTADGDWSAEERTRVGTGTDSDSFAAGVSAHRQAVSRHRAQWERAPTPPGYWNIGFPDTQAVEQINKQAAEQHHRKRQAVAKEAKEEGGRYRRRA